MTNEDLDRAMRFVLENQAQFGANMQVIEEKLQEIEDKQNRAAIQHAALEDVVMKLAQSHVELVNSHKQLADSHARITDSHARITDSHARLVDSHTQLADSQKRLAEAQAETQERLDAFIVFFEKYISSRNGGDRPPH